jgi:hypothetical protein
VAWGKQGQGGGGVKTTGGGSKDWKGTTRQRYMQRIIFRK